MGKEIKPIRNLEIKSPPRTKQVWLRKDKFKCQVVLNSLKAKSSSKWYLDSGCPRYMIGEKSSFISLENFDGGICCFWRWKPS